VTVEAELELVEVRRQVFVRDAPVERAEDRALEQREELVDARPHLHGPPAVVPVDLVRDLALDTDAVSALLEGDVGLLELLRGVTRFALPVIVVGEYRFGLQRSRHRKKLAALLDELVAESDLLVGFAPRGARSRRTTCGSPRSAVNMNGP
jgi:hypothetical protein